MQDRAKTARSVSIRVSEKLLLAAVCAGAGALLYAILETPLSISIAIIAAAVVALLYSEKAGYGQRLFHLFAQNRSFALAAIALVLFLLPFSIRQNPYLIHILVMACLMVIVSFGLNFQMGSANMTNFAIAAFFGIGAYASALWNIRFGFSPWLGIPFALVVTAALAYVVCLPTLKTKGYYLALVTIALQMAFTLLIVNTDWLGGSNGIPGIRAYSIGGHSFHSPLSLFGCQLPYQANYYYLALVFVFLGIYVASRLRQTLTGLTWNAIGEDELAAACQGVSPSSLKLLAFTVGGAFTGVAGAVYAHYIGFISTQDFDFSESLVIICMVILGGSDNVAGVALGAVVLTLIDQKLSDITGYRMLFYGVILVLVLLVRQEGLLPRNMRNYDALFSPADPDAGLEKLPSQSSFACPSGTPSNHQET